jgi:hypothetical protein
MNLDSIVDLAVAVVLTAFGVYLIIYGIQAVGETTAGEVTAQSTYTTLLTLMLPLVGIVLIVSSIIVLMK